MDAPKHNSSSETSLPRERSEESYSIKEMDGGDQPSWSKEISSSGGVQGHNNAVKLRFRPIAPKPANAGLLPQASISLLGSKRVRKRKYVRVPKGTNNRRRKTVSNKRVLPVLPKREGLKLINPSSDEIVTLNLLSEAGDPERNPPEKPRQESRGKGNNSIITNHQCNDFIALCDRTMVEPELVDSVNDYIIRVPDQVVESWVTVEYVMNTHCSCMNIGQENGRVTDLEADTCPGFVTDAGNTVRWVNEAYRRLVAGDRSADVLVLVWLVIKDELYPRIGSSSKFSCLVKVSYKTASEIRQSKAMVVPCDVWRMEIYDGFAWRLDLVAALKLGCS